MTSSSISIIPSVNYHVLEACNMRCKFCFAPFKDAKGILKKGFLVKEDALSLLKEISRLGFKKITFAGGEPTLYPWITDLIVEAKNLGMTTMIVTNGTNINDEFLNKHKGVLDWIILSIDSFIPDVNIQSGRAINGKKAFTTDDYLKMINLINEHGFKLKINTVVHQFNYEESFLDFISMSKTERWKVFQVLPIKGENDKYIEQFKITDHEFNQFLSNHQTLIDSGILVPESNSQMVDSYVMIDPVGRFYTNKKGYQEYSKSILEVGVYEAYKEMDYNIPKFLARNGMYDWD